MGPRTVALLGATGYTGRLVAAELAAKDVPHRLGGRSRDRLDALPTQAPRHVVDLSVAASLDAFLDGADVLISCVGPFVELGGPAVEAAVRNSLAYLDSTGEISFMNDAYSHYAGAASAVVPACGFDYLPGDLAAAVAAEELERAGGGPAEDVTVVYRLAGGRPSRGTARSAAGMLGSMRVRPRRLQVDGPDGTVDAVQVPWGEDVTIPRHLPGARVRSGLATGRRLAGAADVAGAAAPAFGALFRVASPGLRRLAERLPEGPEPLARSRARATVVVQATSGAHRARVVVECRDVYGLTARFLVAASQAVTGTGAMTPAQALPARGFLDSVSGEDAHGSFSWRVL